MLYTASPATITVAGSTLDLGMHPDAALARAVVISLFTWRRAEPDDLLPGDERMGWWGDSYPDVPGDRIGSRLWLLARSTLTTATLNDARVYAIEALTWMVDDGVVAAVDATAVRNGQQRLDLTIHLTRTTGGKIDLRYADAWEKLNAV